MTNQRYIELTYIVAENEEEEEHRDYSRISKVTQAIINHSAYSCIGSSSCLKQKNIKKLFPQTLKQCELLNQTNVNASSPKKGDPKSGVNEASASFNSISSNINSTMGNGLNSSVNLGARHGQRTGRPQDDEISNNRSMKSMSVLRKPGLAGEIEDKVTTDFMKLVDFMQD